MVKRVGIVGVAVAIIAWAIYMTLTVAAYAHTLPMSEVRLGIRNAVSGQFGQDKVVIRLQGCRRVDYHSGMCVVRVYYRSTRARPEWCGVGWARLIGRGDDVRVGGNLTRCPAPGGSVDGGPAA